MNKNIQSQNFQHNLNSGWGPRELDPFHFGYDYDLGYGSKVLAPAPGTVKGVFWDTVGGGGNMITIDHGNGVITWYAHLSQQLVKVGDRVVVGTDIARSGNSGVVTGAHLHFQVMLNGVAQDPKGYMTSCDKLPEPPLVEGATDVPVEFQGNAVDPYNGKTYADVMKFNNQKNYIDVILNDKNELVGQAKVSDTKSYMTYLDNKDPNKITIFGLAPPKGASWIYRVTKKSTLADCLVSGWQCIGVLASKLTEIIKDNSTTTTKIHITNQKEIANSVNTGTLPTDYGIADVDSLGRWKIVLNKISDGIYKSDSSTKQVAVGKSFTFASFKDVNFDISEFVPGLKSIFSSAIDDKSSMKASSPENKYTNIDQNLFVTGDWDKTKYAYYDDKYLDNRIVKFIVAGKKPTKESQPTKVNLFTHGWNKDGPPTNDRNDPAFWSWVSSSGDDSIEMARIASINDPNSLNLVISWTDASVDLSRKNSGDNSVKQIWFAMPQQASKWIDPVARVMKKQLDEIIKNEYPTLSSMSCTGHSLGSFLCNELGELVYNAKSLSLDKITALDPAKENRTLSYIYNLDGVQEGYLGSPKRLDYNNYFSKFYGQSSAYFGGGGLCGNEYLAKTANVVTVVDFGTSLPKGIEGKDDGLNECKIHRTILKIYLKILSEKSKFTLPDFNNISILDISKGDIVKFSDLPRDTIMKYSLIDFGISAKYISDSESYLEYIIRDDNNSDKFILYGTDGNDIYNIRGDDRYSNALQNPITGGYTRFYIYNKKGTDIVYFEDRNSIEANQPNNLVYR